MKRLLQLSLLSIFIIGCQIQPTIKNNQSKINYIISDTIHLNKIVITKINKIGQEVSKKLGINIYIDIKETNGINMDLPKKQRIKLVRLKDKQILQHTRGDCFVIAFAHKQLYINILSSKNLNKIIDKNNILDRYIIPLLASKENINISNENKISAAILIGYTEIANSLAKRKGIKLKSTF